MFVQQVWVPNHAVILAWHLHQLVLQSQGNTGSIGWFQLELIQIPLQLLTYAGPLPLNPVTASMEDSGTWSQIPTELKSSFTDSASFDPANVPREKTLAPALTTAGVLDMTRITLDPIGSTSSIALMGIPSAMETSRFFMLTSFLISWTTFGTTFGLIAIMTTSASFSTSLLLFVVLIPRLWKYEIRSVFVD